MKHTKNICVLLPLEVYSREFDAKLLLATKLSQHGYKVIMADHNHIRYMTYMFSKGVYIGKNMHLYPPPYKKVIRKIFGKTIFNTWYFDLLKKRSYSTIYLEEEGAFFAPKDSGITEKFLKARFSPEILGKDDYVATWGEKQSLFYKNNAINKNNIINTGHPRFDLYKKQFRDFYKDDACRYNDLYGEYILINTNYSFANHAQGIKGTYTKSSIYDPNNRDIMLEYSKKMNEQMMRYSSMNTLIFTLAVEFPSKTFVLRPHPGEDEDVYKYIFKDIKNVVISKEESVGAWLLGSKCLIHDGCTTGLEAALLEKQIINFNPIPLRYSYNELLTNFGEKTTTIVEVVTLVKKIFTPKITPSINNYLFDDLSSVVDNLKQNKDDVSSENIIDILKNINESKIKNGLLRYNFFILVTFIPYMIADFLKGIYSIWANKNFSRYHYKKTTSYGFSKTRFHQKLDSLTNLTNSHVNAKHISNHCFVFEPTDQHIKKYDL
ncbi:hypothetical protein N9I24_04830 [Gammaproteobacteria bacterium]|nr:hypothetical protein [Gammaproteobacteria bacterium]